MVLWRMLVVVAALAAIALPTQGSAEFRQLTPPFEQQDYLTGFPNDGHFGPVGIAFYPKGEDILVSDVVDGNLYRFTGTGGAAGKPLAHVGTVLGIAFAGDGKLYAASRTSSSVVEIDPSNGKIVRTVASGFSSVIAGLAVDPKSTDIFVTDEAANSYAHTPGVFRVNPKSGEVSVFASGDLFPAPDGLVFDPDGTLYVANEREGGDVVRIDRDGTATVLVTLPGGPDGLAVGKPGGSLGGSLIANRNDGVISRIDLTKSPPEVTTFASGGTRGDFVAVSPDGYLFATQMDRVVKFSPASFDVAVGGTQSDLPFKVYTGIIGAILLALAAFALIELRRRRAIRRHQLAVVAANPKEVEVVGALAHAPATPGQSSTGVAGRLIYRAPDGTVTTYEVGDGAVNIGSRPDCVIRLSADPQVASYHVRVWYQDGRYRLHHTGGDQRLTLVNGEPADWLTLDHGDVIQVGATQFRFER